jgi:VWFA-related protein
MPPMRAPAFLLLTVLPLAAQFKSTVPLVVAPTTVADQKGRPVDGLTSADLIFYDNNVPQAIQVDFEIHPISLVVLIQASSNAAAILDKIGRIGVLFSALVAGEAGETAVASFSNRFKLAQDFTADPDRLSHAVRNLRIQGDGVALFDALHESLGMLAARDPSRRRVMLVIAERRDRSSQVKLAPVLREAELANAAIYWLTYSTFLTPFTNRPKTQWDRMTDEERAEAKKQHPFMVDLPEMKEPLPPDLTPGSLLDVFTSLKRQAQVDAAVLLSSTTGGRTFGFLKQSGLEDAIQAVGSEVHSQYIVTFQPKPDAADRFHALRAEVKGRPELQIRTRAGYWSLP